MGIRTFQNWARANASFSSLFGGDIRLRGDGQQEPAHRPVARRPTGESLCRPMTIGQSFRRRPTFLALIDIHSL